jgi:hypothetical protein
MAINTTILGPSRPCGGSRAGPNCLIERAANPGEQVVIDVRGSAYGEAFLTGPDSIEATWFTAKLVGTIPDVGRVVFTTRSDAPSRVNITPTVMGVRSLIRRAIFRSSRLVQDTRFETMAFRGRTGRLMTAITDATFLPAFASQRMFYDVQVMSQQGEEVRRLRGTSPMDFEAEIAAIPPLGTTFRTRSDVDFIDVANGELSFRMLAGAPGLVNNAPGLDMTLLSSNLDLAQGRFDGTIGVAAVALPPSRVCWFVTSVMGATLSTQAQAVDVPFENGLQIPVAASFGDSDTRAALIIQCFSSDESTMEAHLVIVFRDL